jgi:hypothetical protein
MFARNLRFWGVVTRHTLFVLYDCLGYSMSKGVKRTGFLSAKPAGSGDLTTSFRDIY